MSRYHCRIFIFQSYEGTKIMSKLIDSGFYFIPHLVWRIFGKHIIYALHAGAQSLTFIDINSNKDFITFRWLLSHLLKWKKKILLEPPIQKCANLINLANCKNAHLTKCKKRYCCSSYKPILGILIYKYTKLI